MERPPGGTAPPAPPPGMRERGARVRGGCIRRVGSRFPPGTVLVSVGPRRVAPRSSRQSTNLRVKGPAP
jgi:hypothetical protein